ncbi:response regulator [Chamaesiphon sp. OTE_75_metabat_556]|jgi:two-component system, chemotaxis family, response regulator PixH|uniref:response regulator transcription factor n=1 Tax=Chamaesiphon sp. OTE_75_metabat_556 TaxID=2964692 RepID=UPI00286A6A81|nr:response regulator [Chamaesiphon sp. OTE_75_metabat_556]
MVKILVVEDTPSEMKLMTLYLKDNGYQVISTDNAKDGLAMVDKEKPDLVITDVVMEGMNGFEFCRTLKKNPETEKIPVIACTSRSQDLDKIWGKKQGVDVYVTKPYSQEDIINAVKSVFN